MQLFLLFCTIYTRNASSACVAITFTSIIGSSVSDASLQQVYTDQIVGNCDAVCNTQRTH